MNGASNNAIYNLCIIHMTFDLFQVSVDFSEHYPSFR